jgi:hypothetical protein
MGIILGFADGFEGCLVRACTPLLDAPAKVRNRFLTARMGKARYRFKLFGAA